MTTSVRVEPEHHPSQAEEGNQYVYLVASAPSLGFQEEKEVLLSSRSGYLLLHTDKPIYTPNQEGEFRMIVLTAFH